MGVLLINTVLLIVMIIVAIVLCVIGVIVGFNLGVAHRKKIAEAEFGSAEEKAKSIVKDAEKAADAKKRELLLEAKEENQKLRADFDAEVKERRNELNRQERRINQKEENLDKKTDNLEKKEQTLSQKLKSLESKEKEIAEIKEQQMALIEKISGLTAEEAKTILLKDVENQTKHEAAMMVKEIEQEAKENAEKKAKNIVSLAIQKVAADHVAVLIQLVPQETATPGIPPLSDTGILTVVQPLAYSILVTIKPAYHRKFNGCVGRNLFADCKADTFTLSSLSTQGTLALGDFALEIDRDLPGFGEDQLIDLLLIGLDFAGLGGFHLAEATARVFEETFDLIIVKERAAILHAREYSHALLNYSISAKCVHFLFHARGIRGLAADELTVNLVIRGRSTQNRFDKCKSYFNLFHVKISFLM